MSAPRTTSALAGILRWTGGLAFGASLLFVVSRFLVAWGVPWSSSATGATPGAVVIDTLLFTGFALHHSLFARLGLRAWVGRTVGADLERTVYVIVASGLFALVGAAWRPVAGVWWTVGGAARLGLHALQLCGVWLALRSAAILDIRDLAGLPPGPGGRRACGFTTNGPYGWVRHPIYLAWWLLVWPTSTMTGTRGLFALVSCVYLVVAIPLEERTLLRSDPAYADYQRQVRWRLLPFLY